MGIIESIKRWWNMVFATKAKEAFNIKNIESSDMEKFITDCSNIYHGHPAWANAKKGIKTVNFARFICSETAKLSTLGMSIVVEGDSERVKLLQKQIDDAKKNFRAWIEYAGAYGTIILKPNGETVDCYLPSDYIVTDQSNGAVTGIVFFEQEQSADGKTFYTRLEYHRWIDDVYLITNKCYVGKTKNDVTTPLSIEDSPWKNLQEEIGISGITEPLFAVMKMAGANSVDVDSPLALPVFAHAIEELKDLDIAYSRNAKEIYDSKRTTLIDQDRLMLDGRPVLNARQAELAIEQMDLPEHVRMVAGSSDTNEMYQEINPSLNTDMRMTGINALLSQIGFKCGFSNGYFVFNQSTGFTTATQVTADQARTIQLIEDIRKNIDVCIIQLIKAINIFEDLYGETGHVDILDDISTNEMDRMIHVHFEPIYTNKEEDRERALRLTNSGYYPKWYYLHIYEGLSEEDAKALTEEAKPKEQGLFDE